MNEPIASLRSPLRRARLRRQAGFTLLEMLVALLVFAIGILSLGLTIPMATHATNGEVKVDNYSSGSVWGMFHLRGGIVEQYYGAFFTFNQTTGALLTGFGRDFHYDKRGLASPYYPTTIRFNTNMPTAHTLSWKQI